MSATDGKNTIEPVSSARYDEKLLASIDNDEAVLGLALELDSGFQASPQLQRRVRCKIDFILLPLISCTATLSFLDKVSNNYANNASTILSH